MSARMVSMGSPSTARPVRNPSYLLTKGMGPVPETNQEFTEWWEQWMTRVEQTRANAGKLTVSQGERKPGLPPRPISLVGAIAACRRALVTVFPGIGSTLNL